MFVLGDWATLASVEAIAINIDDVNISLKYYPTIYIQQKKENCFQ